MKLTTFFMFLATLQISAGVYSQNAKLNLTSKTYTLAGLIEAIESQSDFKIFYKTDQVDVRKEINLKAENKTIAAVLDQALEGTEVTYRVLDKLIVLTSSKEVIQQQKVTGKVTDSKSGEALPGVSIQIEGTNVGTMSDVNGKFSIDVPDANAKGALLFSYLGYLQERIQLPSQSSLEIKLVPDVKQLEEVVVVGYGTQKKSDITGSVTSVSKARLAKLPVSNVMQAMEGAAAGVNIVQASSIPGASDDVAGSTVVRGKGSINANNAPFIVVDGIALTKTDASMNDINPNDIESIEILKDASATAIYGTNGANGVILITTKRGSAGKPVIRYNAYAGVEEMAHILKPMSGPELLDAYKELNRIDPSKTLWKGSPVRNEYEYDNYTNGKTTDWIDAVSQQGIIQDHNISVSGGSEKSKYYVSGDYFNEKGVLKGYNYRRFSLRTNIDANVTKYITLGTSSYFVAHNTDGGRANLLNAEAMSPYGRMYNADGKTYSQYPMFGETLWSNPLLNTTIDPERRRYNSTINGYGEIDFGSLVKPLSGLKFRTNASYTYAPQRTNEYGGKSVYDVNNGHATLFNFESQTWTIENILSYSKDIKLHHFDLTAMYGAKSKIHQESTSDSKNFPDDALGWSSMGSGTTQSVTSKVDHYSSLSQMGRLNYSYNSRYLFTFTVRRDGSSVFGANHKYGVFPTMALGWNLAKESFMKSVSNVMNDFKLRASYGRTGNEAIPINTSELKLDPNSMDMFGLNRTTIKSNRSMGNADLTWETNTSLNVGLDFGLFNNRISGTVDVYNKINSDLLMKRNIASINGYDNVWQNLGKVTNKGVEVTLNTKNLNIGGFTWNTTIIFATNKSKINTLYGDGKDDINNKWFIGQPLGVIYDYKKVGIWQTDEITSGTNKYWDATAVAGDLKLADINNAGNTHTPDSTVNVNDRMILGQTDPKWTGGITNEFAYKGLSLRIFIQTVQGLMANNSAMGIAADERGRRATPQEIGYWTPDNHSNTWSSLGPHANSHGYGFPTDASYTRIKDVTLSYTLPAKLIKKMGINGLTFYVSGKNLYTFTKWIGWDPEQRSVGRGSSTTINVETGATTDWQSNYPLVRSYVFGINLSL